MTGVQTCALPICFPVTIFNVFASNEVFSRFVFELIFLWFSPCAAAEQLQADARGKFAPFLRDPNYFGELTQNVWNVQPETGLHGAHPAPFPVLIAQRLMHLYAPHGSLVLDPFAGSGTVGVAAKKNGYRAALLDVSPVYCALARERIEAAQ